MARVNISAEGRAKLDLAVGKMMRHLVREIEDDARNNAPVDTGELAASVFSETDGNDGRIGAAAEHAAYVELGTSEMRAQPFLRPALYKKRAVHGD